MRLISLPFLIRKKSNMEISRQLVMIGFDLSHIIPHHIIVFVALSSYPMRDFYSFLLHHIYIIVMIRR